MGLGNPCNFRELQRSAVPMEGRHTAGLVLPAEINSQKAQNPSLAIALPDRT